jgi:plastocyanin
VSVFARRRISTAIAPIAAIALLVPLLAACGDDDDGSTPSSSADVKELTLTISDGKVDPELGDVEVEPGQKVELTVTSDVADEIHAHTSDEGVEAELEPGKPTTMDITAPTVPGVYEIETHETGLKLFELVVR